MKKILCYGDSNTWGWIPATKERYGRDERWPGVLRLALGEGYEIIEEGLPGRTTVWNDPIEARQVDTYMNGRIYLLPCLGSHKPLDLVVIMLGSNDLKKRFSVSAFDIANGAGVLVNIVQQSDAGRRGGAPDVLLVTPPPLARLSDSADMFDEAPCKSIKLAKEFQRVAEEYGCALLDAGQHVVSSDVDGAHLEPGEHRKLGQAVAARVRQILG